MSVAVASCTFREHATHAEKKVAEPPLSAFVHAYHSTFCLHFTHAWKRWLKPPPAPPDGRLSLPTLLHWCLLCAHYTTWKGRLPSPGRPPPPTYSMPRWRYTCIPFYCCCCSIHLVWCFSFTRCTWYFFFPVL